jgi:hypothetical protein
MDNSRAKAGFLAQMMYECASTINATASIVRHSRVVEARHPRLRSHR